ncbi:hypothetical protein [Variovorax sp. PAMC26660]|uniref:hypothetical protein n=1 Tax=Variovorax sp. PAMC26660 TaxID=2762322 RepID=UPI00164D6257|nr:hypothetical protein [Variovorax sp. PAMC26660]QNK71248.1 hypothetical protein H7F35_16875 [Variovorax sp. PAMC26660]
MNTSIQVPRNPFGVQDAPDPNGEDINRFAAGVRLDGAASDVNAVAWGQSFNAAQVSSIGGAWSSRWNGGADPTIPGDTAAAWKQGEASVKIAVGRIYMLFDWSDGARRALLDVRQVGLQQLVGRYINLSNPAITQPWVGLIVDNRRIDGRWTHGRLDFRR